MARYNYTVQYENNRGQKINLTELPYAINIEPLLDYSWAYATRDRRRGSRVAGFNKAVASKSVTLHILGTTVEERNEAIDAFNNIVEVDIYDGVAGKIWFDNWYTYGYIVSSQNEKWQYDKGIIKKTLELVREEETWYHVIVKNSYSEIPDEDEDFELGIKDYELSPYIHEVTETPDTTPYLFRPSPSLEEDYDRLLLDKVVGGTLAVNQLVPIPSNSKSTTVHGITLTDNRDGTYTFSGQAESATYFNIAQQLNPPTNHVYALLGLVSNVGIGMCDAWSSGLSAKYTDTIFKNTSTARFDLAFYVNTSFNAGTGSYTVKPQLVDLTAFFGSATTADYVYNLEQSTAGSGVAWLKQYYPSIFNSYQPYNAGELMSVEASAHVMTGVNQFDKDDDTNWKQWAVVSGGLTSGSAYRSAVLPCLPNTAYYAGKTKGGRIGLASFPTYPTVSDHATASGFSNSGEHISITTGANDTYIVVWFYNGNVDSGIGVQPIADTLCVNISNADINGNYYTYTQTSYPLDSDLVLRGIPKLNNGVPYYDGDIYESAGSVTRKYGIVDLGTLTWVYDSSATYPYFRTDGLGSVIKKVSSHADYPNCICSNYAGATENQGYVGTATRCISETTWGQIRIRDNNYTDATTFKTAMDGVYLVYELETPTTETADPYDRVQECYKGGTEEFVSSTVVPVGHETKYGLANPVGYDYAYDYGLDKVSQIEVTNPNPLGCNFVIAISGPVNNPYIKIGDTIVNVNVEVVDGANLVVDSGAKTITLTLPDGIQVNAFGARNPDYYIFELIESGVNPIVWDGSFSWQLQMIEERSEPRWLMG